ncbi:MAG: hypothetical protein H6832_05630 [Planctomycetes bacterium]|nr:hypothetical protein [Planctomycetota bacterium]MCB9892593.1 hypothetical protein [Planctomycetota bacterium]MCB9917864.1 hypothetical protein [Planctomycetota bacterium]
MPRTELRSLAPLFLLMLCASPTLAIAAPQEESQADSPGLLKPMVDHFRVSNDCALCHSQSPRANAMRNAMGDDVSPYGLWSATMMGNAFRDPYFQAQMQKESLSRGEAVQVLCLRCHTPMAYQHRVMNGEKPPRLADLFDDRLAQDGVSCTMCHQITAEGLGEERTFSGRPVMGKERKIFGPFENPATGPMRMHVKYTPTHAPHVQTSALCATCHTLSTAHAGKVFPEQSPYLEWRNSEFNDEQGATATSKTCQQCHMPKTGPTRMARNPAGVDFLIDVREDFRAHAFVGGNSFMLDLLRENRDQLGVTAEPAALARMAAASRRQLGEDTVKMTIRDAEVEDGVLTFDTVIENLTGHKFPTGYPSRRAWLRVQVRRGRQVLFETGAYDDEGRILHVRDELAQPHRSRVEKPSDVVIYEMVAEDPEGQPTTHLTKMTRKHKDNRLLPRGWRRNGPHLEETAPVGLGNDVDFVDGRDKVHFHVPIEGDGNGIRIVAWLYYQSVPPAWVDALRDVDADACRDFVKMYDAASKAPETVAVVAQFVQASK